MDEILIANIKKLKRHSDNILKDLQSKLLALNDLEKTAKVLTMIILHDRAQIIRDILNGMTETIEDYLEKPDDENKNFFLN